MTVRYAGTTTPSIRHSPTNPIITVISDQKTSETVMIHLREKRSPANPASIVIAASVQLSAVLIQPMWTSVSPRSSWIGLVRSPKSARSAWWKKKAHPRSASRNHL